MESPRRAVIYCRISDDREGKRWGVERQERVCRARAAELHWDVAAVHIDDDRGAYAGKPRPGYEATLNDLRDGCGDAVLALAATRLQRRVEDSLDFFRLVRGKNIEVEMIKGGRIDLTTAAGLRSAYNNAVEAEIESMLIGERVRDAKADTLAAGGYRGGPRPFGYEADGVTVHEAEAAAIREAADALLAGASLRAICRNWEACGIRTVPRRRRLPDGTRGEPVSRAWDATELRRMLLRPRNAGIIEHRGREMGAAQWPPILDEPTWRSLRAVLTQPERRTTPGNGRKWLGSGIYLCGVCGETLRCSTSGTGAGTVHMPAYRCRSLKHVTRRCDLLDEYVRLLILVRVSQPGAADLLVEREDPVDVSGAQADMRQARATLDQLAAALGQGELDMQSWRIASASAQARLSGAEEILSRAVRANPVIGLVGAPDPEAVWDSMDLSRRRAVVAWLMTVTVHPARKGRLPGGARLDTASIEVEWRQR